MSRTNAAPVSTTGSAAEADHTARALERIAAAAAVLAQRTARAVNAQALEVARLLGVARQVSAPVRRPSFVLAGSTARPSCVVLMRRQRCHTTRAVAL